MVFVAYPLWAANQLIGTPAEEFAYSFIPVLVSIIAMPWGYVVRTFILPANRTRLDVARGHIDASPTT